jgi:hypothetical protein
MPERRLQMKLESFDEVLASIKKNRPRPFHLLLGNGFSMAYDSAIFSYHALHDFVINQENKDVATILKVIETRNFEIIMQYLDHFSALIAALGGDHRLKNRIDSAIENLKSGLLGAVKKLHPEHIFKIPEIQSKACANFLQVFLETNGSIYSTNYDLLLYWVLMRNSSLRHVDGCGRVLENDTNEFIKPEDQVWSELIWGKNRDDQNVFYLHGALPFFDRGISIVKEEYDAYNYLLQKISERMENGEYPIFVTAGNGTQKLSHIMHNKYLTYCYERFSKTQGSLVTFGFSFGQYDEHIIEAINAATKQEFSKKLWSIYIGVYGDESRDHIERIAGKFKCKVHIFDAKTIDVWGKSVP